MGCFNCGNGLFYNTGNNWNSIGSSPITLPNGITLTPGSGGSQVFVSKSGSGSTSFLAPGGGQVHYFSWGASGKYLAILTVEGGAGGATRTVSIVNANNPALTAPPILNFLAPSTTLLPVIQTCPGDGGAVLLIGQDGTNVIPVMCVSETGQVLCSAVPFAATNQVMGNATAALFEILEGSNPVPGASCPRPAGNSHVSPLTSGKVDFGTAIIGGLPSAATTTRTVTITNTGNNCLTISSLTNSAHFALVPGTESKPFPVTLQASESFHFDVRFTPNAVTADTVFDENMPINPTPAATDTSIHCHAHARPATHTISFADVNFNAVPINPPVAPTRNLTIINTGEAPVTVTLAPGSSGQYSWPGIPAASSIVAVGGSVPMAVTFTPTVEGPDNRILTFTSTATGSPHTVHLNGAGCVARPVIQVPAASGPLDFGNVQVGFHTVRMCLVNNTGNGTLNFSARIAATIPGDVASTADAALFGVLQDNSVPVTAPPSEFDNQPVAPAAICGPGSTGSGNFLFGVSFFGSGSPRTVHAKLEIFNHNDTTSGAPAVISVPLTAAVANPVSVDVELVLDRSGSMADPSGSRTKIETARDAAKLFVALSRPDVHDRIGLVRFNSTPEQVSAIQEITSGNHDAIGATVNAANFFPNGTTCIAGGVMVAQKDMQSHPRPTPPALLNKVVIVLTDGMDNTPYNNPDDGVAYSLLGGPLGGVNTTALPVPSDTKIYALGIGDEIDVGRLGTLATSTGGQFLHAREFSGADYFSLEKYFTQVYMEGVNYAVVSDPVFTINAGETQQFQFEVLDGDKSAMVVIYDKDGIRIPFYIQSPTGQTIDLLSAPAGFQIRPGITPTARFIEINMPQGNPADYAGAWTVIVKHDKKACYAGGANELKGAYSAGGNWDMAYAATGFTYGFQPTRCETGYNEPILYGIALGVGSDFNMIPFVTPGIVHIGDPIQLTAMVAEFGLPVTGATVTVMARRPDGVETTHVLIDDGLHGDDTANDGAYGLSYIHTYQEGSYTFTFSCDGHNRDGKLVHRESVRSKYVEGHTPLIPPPATTGGNGGSGTEAANACCRAIQLLLRILVVLGFLGIILLILLLQK